MNENFQIGQIIYLLIITDKAQKIMPAIIHEQVFQKSFKTNKVSYKVLIGSPKNPKSQIVDLNKLLNEDSVVYTSIEEIREYMLEHFAMYVNELCENAQNKAQEWYSSMTSNDDQENPNENETIDPEKILEEVSEPIQAPSSNGPVLVDVRNGVAKPIM